MLVVFSARRPPFTNLGEEVGRFSTIDECQSCSGFIAADFESSVGYVLLELQLQPRKMRSGKAIDGDRRCFDVRQAQTISDWGAACRGQVLCIGG